MFVYWFVKSIITYKPFNRFASNYDRGTPWDYENVLSLY